MLNFVPPLVRTNEDVQHPVVILIGFGVVSDDLVLVNRLVKPSEISLESLTLAPGQPFLGKLIVLLVEELLKLLTLVKVQNLSNSEPVVLGIRRWCFLHELKLVVDADLGRPFTVVTRVS